MHVDVTDVIFVDRHLDGLAHGRPQHLMPGHLLALFRDEHRSRDAVAPQRETRDVSWAISTFVRNQLQIAIAITRRRVIGAGHPQECFRPDFAIAR